MATPTVSAPSPAAVEASTPIQKLGFAVSCIYLFIITCRVFDVAFSRLRIPMAFFILSVIAALVAGDVFRALKSRITLTLVAMLGWMGVATVFSTWPGGSAKVFMTSLNAFVFAAVIIALGRTTAHARQLMNTLAYSTIFAALLSFVFGVYSEGRLALYQGTYGDPNQYAMGLLMGLPLLLLVAREGMIVKRILLYAGVAVVCFVFLRTGSRGGAITFVAMMAVMFWQASMKQKLVIVLAGVLMFAGAMLFLPQYLKARYFTLFSADAATMEELNERQREMVGADVGSANGRLQLLWDSIEMTAEHPLFGVGPGQFAMQRWEKKKAEGIQGAGYFVTHNSYTQMSSETGVPGLIILLALLGGCIRGIGKVLETARSPGSRAPEEVIQIGVYLRLSLVTVAVCAFFLSVPYTQLFYIMAAVTAVYYHGAQAEVAQWQAAAAGGPPVPARAPLIGGEVLLPALRRVRGFGRHPVR